MHLGRTRSVALQGVQGALIDVEAHIAEGLPHVAVTGLPDKACAQAPDRIRSAAAVSGCPLPNRRITINLSPAALPKAGTLFDLPIAVAVLRAAGVIRNAAADAAVHLGELGLDGTIRAGRGVLPAVLAASRHGVRRVVVPPGNVAEAQLVDGLTVHTAPTLRELVAGYAAGSLAAPAARESVSPGGPRRPDLADVVGQHEARLALELAAVGGHHLLLAGPPGAGKTMLAERLVTILPPLRSEEALQTLAIRSLTGGTFEAGLDRTPPFVAPHHTASEAAIVGGGGGVIVPGAISRAHNGVLFLDEAPEFNPAVLQTLRQPLESGEVVIARARQLVCYPARFLLVLAANPCPCGHAWGKGLDCTCRPQAIRAYAARLNGPLLDRVDLQIKVAPVPRKVFGDVTPEPSAAVAARVLAARAAQRVRWRAIGLETNGMVPGHLLRTPPWRLPGDVTASLDRSLDTGRLTLRGYDRVLRVAWSVADTEGHDRPLRSDVDVALGMRTLERVAA